MYNVYNIYGLPNNFDCTIVFITDYKSNNLVVTDEFYNSLDRNIGIRTILRQNFRTGYTLVLGYMA